MALEFHRRRFLKVVSAGMAASALPGCTSLDAAKRQTNVTLSSIALPENQTSNWLGGYFWGNRLQDWRLHDGRIDCLNGAKAYEARTAHCLTHDLNASHRPARMRAVISHLNGTNPGLGGFLIGAGAGELDYRQAALIQSGAGHNGGILAVIDHNGELSLRDFSDGQNPLAFDAYEIEGVQSGRLKEALTQDGVTLDCHLDPVANNAFDIRLSAYDVNTGDELGFVVTTNVPASRLRGNIALFSSATGGADGARFGFENIQFGGGKMQSHKDRKLDEVMGCLHSLNGSILKLTAQFMPVDLARMPNARLDYKETSSSEWQAGPVAEIGDGFAALFRQDQWESTQDFDYRIVLPKSQNRVVFEGQILKDPGISRPLKVALHSCLLPTSRSLDNLDPQKKIASEESIDRFAEKNLLFPHTTLVGHCETHDPDLYLFCGDQYYETYPTRPGRDSPDAKLDTLYRWYLWFWTFRDAIRDKPCIVLADDHDILQGNLWGEAGEHSDEPKEEDGGYKHDKALVRMVYRIQCGHNPDSYDPTPIKYDIPVTYGSFIYGGTNFAFVEDRKFKTAPDYETDPLKTTGVLLGARQEKFLKEWGKDRPELPHICLTASVWGSPQTDQKLQPLLDYDANGYPPDGRTRAVKLLRNANALALAGDQHLALVSRQGIESYEDGPLFFAGPAGAAFWQRWFEGGGKLDNQFNGNPNSGNFIDTFGNKMRVMAVGNPKITHAAFEAANERWGKFLSDRDLKTEGYGIVSVDHENSSYELSCWSWDTDPKTGKQMEGWPIRVGFDEAGRKKT